MSVFAGLMSGTSLDGITAAVVRFEPAGSGFRAELLGLVTRPYAPAERARIEQALVSGTAREYCRLSFDMGAWLAGAAIAVMADAGVARGDIVAIGSHGQTIWHEPPHSTWQLGEAAVIAERTGVPVVSDFRVRDVAAGGQGAPLVPIADALLFAGDRWRALQNLGGMANVTVLPPRGAGADRLDGVRAFDTGPGVAVIDGVVRTLMEQLEYDVDGRLAAAGTPIDAVVDELLRDPYFGDPPPKSTGRERFDAAYVTRLIARCRAVSPACTTDDVVATATALTARSIGFAYERFLPEPVDDVLLSGGGARNPALVRMVEQALAPRRVAQFSDHYFDGDAKEAVAFALLAYLHMQREPANVPAATGARGPRVLGKLTPA